MKVSCCISSCLISPLHVGELRRSMYVGCVGIDVDVGGFSSVGRGLNHGVDRSMISDAAGGCTSVEVSWCWRRRFHVAVGWSVSDSSSSPFNSSVRSLSDRDLFDNLLPSVWRSGTAARRLRSAKSGTYCLFGL